MNHFVKYVCLIYFACSAPAALSQVSYATDFQRLRDQHQKAVQAVVEPLDHRYATELDQLLRKSTQSNDLDTAVKIKEEIKSLRLTGADLTSTSLPLTAREALVGKWNYRGIGWFDVREIKLDGSVKIISGASNGMQGKWILRGSKLIMTWGKYTDTYALPADNDTIKGVKTYPGKKDEEISMTKVVQ